jgi:hypothetical protein
LRIAWATDIHLNFVSRDIAAAFCRSLLATGADHFLLGGDIAEAPSVEAWLQFLESELRKPISFVLGNHDYYLGSIQELRARMPVFQRFSDNLQWLPGAGIVPLSDRSCLIGHDAWGDARLGNVHGTPLKLNDFVHIRELAGLPPTQFVAMLRSLGQEAADHFDRLLPLALSRYRHVVVLTHVPPFRDCCRSGKSLSADDWAPYFCCKVVGDVLHRWMAAYPERRMMVLSGHTHLDVRVEVLPNLRVRTGAANYGAPRLQGIYDIP